MNDIELRVKNINFGFKNKNPFETIYFFNRYRPNTRFKKSMKHLPVMPRVFEESTIIVFCKNKKKMIELKNFLKIIKINYKKMECFR